MQTKSPLGSSDLARLHHHGLLKPCTYKLSVAYSQIRKSELHGCAVVEPLAMRTSLPNQINTPQPFTEPCKVCLHIVFQSVVAKLSRKTNPSDQTLHLESANDLLSLYLCVLPFGMYIDLAVYTYASNDTSVYIFAPCRTNREDRALHTYANSGVHTRVCTCCYGYTCKCESGCIESS